MCIRDSDEGALSIRLSGTAGQSFGAFLAKGIDIVLDGVGNDYVGKGMGGGSIAIRPFTGSSTVPHGAGNACLYGATAGRLFVAGSVGQRFAVRNSGAVAVVEGTSDHACEYMTGGVVAIVGEAGRNIAAGMTGGTLFLHDPHTRIKGHLSADAPAPRRLDATDAELLRGLLDEHVDRTGSPQVGSLLDDWDDAVRRFWVLRPEPPATTAEYDEQSVAVELAEPADRPT